MNKDEAIKYLSEFILFKKISNITEKEAVECFELAVEALQQQPSEDCISRTEAIKALEYELSIEADGGLDKYRTVIKDLVNAIYNTQKKAIEDLPSIQPQPKERTETHACDYISREALDNAISDLTYWHFENNRLIPGGGGSKTETVFKVDDVTRLTHILPSVTPQPKTEWIPVRWHNITDEERQREGYPKEWLTMLDCPMPNDEEEILVTVKSIKCGLHVEKDVCYIDDGFSLDSGNDWIDDVIAWMPLPTSYQAESEE